jgi:DNA-binding transcriptional LysR family regulator
MDTFELIRTFRDVAEQGSFSRAATRAGLAKATVSKYVSELETQLGVRLLNRSTRSVSLTDAGALLLLRSAPMLEMLALTRAELQQQASKPGGRLRVSAPRGMGQGRLPALLAKFMGHYPDVRLSLHLTQRDVDMADEAIDVALRFGPVEDDNLIVRKLRKVPLVVCASPRYWTKHGTPAHPGDLAGHDALTSSRLGPHPRWRFETEGRPVDVPLRSRMDANEIAPLIEMAVQGFGVLYVPLLLVQAHIDRGELVAALQGHARSDLWLSAAYLQRRHNSAALRAFLDFLQQHLGEGDVATAVSAR